LVGADCVRVCVLAHHYELVGVVTLVADLVEFALGIMSIVIICYNIRNRSAYVKLSWLVGIHLIVTRHQV